MANETDNNKFLWSIKNVPSLLSNPIESDQFVASGYKWRLVVYPSGSKIFGNLILVLEVADLATLASGWRIHTKYRLTLVNQIQEKLSVSKELQQWFDVKNKVGGFQATVPLFELFAKDGGFFVNDEVKVIAEVKVIEVIGGLDVLEESEEATQLPPKKKFKRVGSVESQHMLKECVNVSGDLPFKMAYLSRVFTKYPDIALVLQAKNQHLKKACMLVLHSVIETLCKSLEELSNDDLVEADNSLTYLKLSGFKVVWLEKKLEEVTRKKKVKQIGEKRIQELEGGLKYLGEKCANVEAVLEKEKAEMLAAETPPLTVDDLIR